LSNESQIQELVEIAANNEHLVKAALCKKSLKYFIQEFWEEVNDDNLIWNWHMDVLCSELEKVAYNVCNEIPKEYDLIINISPGTSKTSIVSIFFPAWVWTHSNWIRFITASYSSALSLESSEKSRDVITSNKFKQYFPLLSIKRDKSSKSNFKLQEHVFDKYGEYRGIKGRGNRYSTSVGATIIGFHGHILLIDDPENVEQAESDKERETANRWMSKTLPTRKANKRTAVTIVIMQRLHQEDVTGYMLDRYEKVRHICLPAEINTLAYRELVKPQELIEKYIDGYLDPNRMPESVLRGLEKELGANGYAGQIGQNPTPPGGNLFKVDFFNIVNLPPDESQIVETIRYWDKAGTQDAGAYSVGVKMSKLKNKTFFVWDVKRAQLSTENREKMILATAKADGLRTKVMVEQEPGSGGKESAEATIRMLSGFVADADSPKGDKAKRADPYATQVNWGNVNLLYGSWNHEFIEEHRFFPNSKYKDQVDAAAAAFNNLNKKKTAGVW
jgi:predicted phage terminase large subunit-like protein